MHPRSWNHITSASVGGDSACSEFARPAATFTSDVEADAPKDDVEGGDTEQDPATDIDVHVRRNNRVPMADVHGALGSGVRGMSEAKLTGRSARSPPFEGSRIWRPSLHACAPVRLAQVEEAVPATATMTTTTTTNNNLAVVASPFRATSADATTEPPRRNVRSTANLPRCEEEAKDSFRGPSPKPCSGTSGSGAVAARVWKPSMRR
mmetsp:Transcript_48967/g.158175  ORF Transcript_48967/g.158175 Transcript_48967/m.158175 type:complete len:207 (+) Transcript_48967:639-1259(+)